MASIRRSGGATAMFWQGRLPDPRDPQFAKALQKHRFRTIEDAASEETSVGWISAGDPTGGSFDDEDLEAGTATWLRFRLDKKQLPRKWLAIHRDAAAKSRGKKLSARERREIKDDLVGKLLPRVLPTVQMVDALLFTDRHTVLLLHTGKGMIEAFGRLFFQTFALPLERTDPLATGRRTGLDRALADRLERIEPVRWPRRDRGDRALAARASTHAATTDPEAEAVDA
jgi:hypothetical protein